MTRSTSRLHLYTLFSLVIMIVIGTFPGCGGQTRGTGGVSLDGRVADVSGLPLAGITVTVRETSQTAVTDAQGQFTLFADTEVESVTLDFRDAQGLDTSGIIDLSNAATILSLDVRVDRPNQTVIINVASPTPTQTPAPGPQSTPTPVVTVTPRPTPISTPTAAPCAPDFNHDGVLNQTDYSAFEAAFNLGDPSADYDGNSFVNGDDFDAFAADFEHGC